MPVLSKNYERTRVYVPFGSVLNGFPRVLVVSVALAFRPWKSLSSNHCLSTVAASTVWHSIYASPLDFPFTLCSEKVISRWSIDTPTFAAARRRSSSFVHCQYPIRQRKSKESRVRRFDAPTASPPRTESPCPAHQHLPSCRARSSARSGFHLCARLRARCRPLAGACRLPVVVK